MKQLHLFLVLAFLSIAAAACQTPDKKSGQQSYNNLNVSEAKDLLSTRPEVVWIDVRTDAEVAEGKIENALHIDINQSDFEEKIKALDKDKEYVVYCRSGGRSVRACEVMQTEGFTKLHNMQGGITGWQAKGFPTAGK